MSEPAVAFDGVTRTFGSRVALQKLDLTVEPGQILGLVGRNGAGKTMSLRLAHGLIYPDSGSIRVLGLDPARQGLELRSRVSLLSEESALYPWMRVTEILDFAAALHPRWEAGPRERGRGAVAAPAAGGLARRRPRGRRGSLADLREERLRYLVGGPGR
jgi:ABC-type multidrug transport system ATPase subunit